jgi:hypothetical protein
MAVVRGQSLFTYAFFLPSLYVIEFIEIRTANSEIKFTKLLLSYMFCVFYVRTRNAYFFSNVQQME